MRPYLLGDFFLHHKNSISFCTPVSLNSFLLYCPALSSSSSSINAISTSTSTSTVHSPAISCISTTELLLSSLALLRLCQDTRTVTLLPTLLPTLPPTLPPTLQPTLRHTLQRIPQRISLPIPLPGGPPTLILGEIVVLNAGVSVEMG